MIERRRGAQTGEGGAGTGSLPAGEVTFLFTDIEGSTSLFRVLGERFKEFLDVHNRIISDAVGRHGGSVVRTEGDAFFCAFPAAPDGVAAALEAQLALTAHPWPDDAVFRVRMGLHSGEARPFGADYVSLAVHQAARVSDAAHGGQLLLSEATRALVQDALPDGASLAPLGEHRLRGFAEPAMLYQLVHSALPSDFGALRALPAAAHNVPEPATLFVGRQTVLDELANVIQNRRLVTVLGAGGVGKTRLAIELVPKVAPRYPDGVWLIELAKLGRGAEIAPEVAGVLGIRVGEGAIETLADAIAAKQMLIVLDNCEHVLDSVAELAQSFVARCPQVTVLVTSREPLALAMEQRFPLAPLAVPRAVDTGDLNRSEAVALFVDRARAAKPGFDMPTDAAPVAEICRRLDGLPLAIELAAARLGSIPLATLASRLDRRFSVLRRGHRGALTHHETLRASIGWSVELLEPDERVLFRRLGVFRGEFDLEAVEAICAGAPLEEDDVLDLTARLVEKSLIQQVDSRYVLLDSIRDYAREEIVSEGDLEELGMAHLAHYTEVVEANARVADGPEQRAAYDRLDADLSNIRAAAEFALERSNEAALRLGAALGQYAFIRNRLGEVAGWCVAAAEAARDAPPALRVGALMQGGFALVVLGSPGQGHALVDEALELARSLDDHQLLFDTLVMAADLRLEAGLTVEAQPVCQEAVDAAIQIGDEWSLGRANYIEAVAFQDERGYSETHQRLLGALELFERVHDRRQMGRVLLTLATQSLAADALDAADAEAVRCVAIADELQHPIGRAVATVVRTFAALERGALKEAADLLDEIRHTAAASGYTALLGATVAAGAALAQSSGDLAQAARMLGAIDAHPDALGGEGVRAITLRLTRLRADLGAALGDEALAALCAEGARRPLADF